MDTKLSIMDPLAKVLLVYVLTRLVSCSLFDPHLYPRVGPFFEGWYVRISDTSTNDSVGALFGRVLPKKEEDVYSSPLVLSSVLYRKCFKNRCKLSSYKADFNSSDNVVYVNGSSVTRDPDVRSPSNFEWTAKSLTSTCSFIQNGNITKMLFRFGNVSLKATIGNPVAWGPNGEGPEGWIERVPFLPLHWFVFSLRSSVISYEFLDLDAGITVYSNKAVAHLEKNWGKSFPTAWIWSEGVSRSGNVVMYALSGGPVYIGPIPITAYLIGYRNSAKNLTLNYRPDNSLISIHHSGCHGVVNVTAFALVHELHLNIEARPSSFSDCLFGPESTGFRKACSESYDAVTSIEVYERHLKSKRIVDKQIIFYSGLEFGGHYTCNNKCGS